MILQNSAGVRYLAGSGLPSLCWVTRTEIRKIHTQCHRQLHPGPNDEEGMRGTGCCGPRQPQ